MLISSIHFKHNVLYAVTGSLSQRVTSQLSGLKGLNNHLGGIKSYLEQVIEGKLPINHQIIYQVTLSIGLSFNRTVYSWLLYSSFLFGQKYELHVHNKH